MLNRGRRRLRHSGRAAWGWRRKEAGEAPGRRRSLPRLLRRGHWRGRCRLRRRLKHPRKLPRLGPYRPGLWRFGRDRQGRRLRGRGCLRQGSGLEHAGELAGSRRDGRRRETRRRNGPRSRGARGLGGRHNRWRRHGCRPGRRGHWQRPRCNRWRRRCRRPGWRHLFASHRGPEQPGEFPFVVRSGSGRRLWRRRGPRRHGRGRRRIPARRRTKEPIELILGRGGNAGRCRRLGPGLARHFPHGSPDLRVRRGRRRFGLRRAPLGDPRAHAPEFRQHRCYRIGHALVVIDFSNLCALLRGRIGHPAQQDGEQRFPATGWFPSKQDVNEDLPPGRGLARPEGFRLAVVGDHRA
jgi:hypothetical protein